MPPRASQLGLKATIFKQLPKPRTKFTNTYRGLAPNKVKFTRLASSKKLLGMQRQKQIQSTTKRKIS